MRISLKACRVNVNATAQEMADFVGVSEDTVYKWENGKTSPNAKYMPKILNFFHSKGFDITLNEINFLA
jgi:DNA-binding XRE family transcriptional regulator